MLCNGEKLTCVNKTDFQLDDVGVSVNIQITFSCEGGSSGLMVMGDNSCSKGCGLEYWCPILGGHFFTLICCRICIVCLKRPKIN